MATHSTNLTQTKTLTKPSWPLTRATKEPSLPSCTRHQNYPTQPALFSHGARAPFHLGSQPPITNTLQPCTPILPSHPNSLTPKIELKKTMTKEHIMPEFQRKREKQTLTKAWQLPISPNHNPPHHSTVSNLDLEHLKRVPWQKIRKKEENWKRKETESRKETKKKSYDSSSYLWTLASKPLQTLPTPSIH